MQSVLLDSHSWRSLAMKGVRPDPSIGLKVRLYELARAIPTYLIGRYCRCPERTFSRHQDESADRCLATHLLGKVTAKETYILSLEVDPLPSGELQLLFQPLAALLADISKY